MKRLRDIGKPEAPRNELRLPRDSEQLNAVRETEGTLPVLDRAKLLAKADELSRLVAPSEAQALMSELMLGVMRRQVSVEETFARVEMALEHARRAMESAKRNLEQLRDSWKDEAKP